MWPPAPVTPARRSEAGSSCRTSRPNHSFDSRHGFRTRYGERKRDRILPQSGGEGARMRTLGIVNARRPRRRKGPWKRRQRCPPRPLERPREGTSVLCRNLGVIELCGPHDLVDGKNLNGLQSLTRCDLEVSSSTLCHLPRNWRLDRSLF